MTGLLLARKIIEICQRPLLLPKLAVKVAIRVRGNTVV